MKDSARYIKIVEWVADIKASGRPLPSATAGRDLIRSTNAT
jgi:hypothetical protein